MIEQSKIINQADKKTGEISYAGYQSFTYFPELDGLRALCILIVISVHTNNPGYWTWLSGHL